MHIIRTRKFENGKKRANSDDERANMTSQEKSVPQSRHDLRRTENSCGFSLCCKLEGQASEYNYNNPYSTSISLKTKANNKIIRIIYISNPIDKPLKLQIKKCTIAFVTSIENVVDLPSSGQAQFAICVDPSSEHIGPYDGFIELVEINCVPTKQPIFIKCKLSIKVYTTNK
ncbi:hypothetical protein GJ496_001069 [Pomphorhynchus laevis]|nr:hypothetical protein GJ496_001069 [Pomphorhynchus laevis]